MTQAGKTGFRAKALLVVVVLALVAAGGWLWWSKPKPFPNQQLQGLARAVGTGDFNTADSALAGDNGQKLIGALLTEPWDQDCAPAAALLQKVAVDRSGEGANRAARAILAYTAQHWQDLSRDWWIFKQSLGKRCPLIARTLAKILIHHLDAAYGTHPEPGFEEILVENDVTKIALVIRTDHAAGEDLGAQGLAAVIRWENEFGESLAGPNAPLLGRMRAAGGLVGSLDRAQINVESSGVIHFDHARYEVATGLLGKSGGPSTDSLQGHLTNGHLPAWKDLNLTQKVELGDALLNYLSVPPTGVSASSGIRFFKEAYERVQSAAL